MRTKRSIDTKKSLKVQNWTYTDRNRQKQTDTVRNKQKQTEVDRNGQGVDGTEGDLR